MRCTTTTQSQQEKVLGGGFSIDRYWAVIAVLISNFSIGQCIQYWAVDSVLAAGTYCPPSVGGVGSGLPG